MIAVGDQRKHVSVNMSLSHPRQAHLFNRSGARKGEMHSPEVLAQFIERASESQPPLVDYEDMIGDPLHFGYAMRREEDRGAFRSRPHNGLQHLFGGDRI